MEPDMTEVTTSGEPHQLVYMCRQHYKKKSHMNKKQNTGVYVTQVQVSGVSREVRGHKSIS